MSAKDLVLVVDDDPSNRVLLRRILERREHAVVEAADGEEALVLARTERPALILLDVQLPGLDGYEVCRRLKADPETSRAPVIFLSALGGSGDKVRGFEAGGADYLGKPFHKEEVATRVATHLTLQRLQRELEGRNLELERELRVAEELVRQETARLSGPLLGESPALRALLAEIESAGPGGRPVLLTSSGGAGEEAVARAIHAASERARRPFLVLDCLSIPDPSGDDLFGAQTRWSLAREGTLFLARLDALPPRLIRQLEERLEDASLGAPRVVAYQRAELADGEVWRRVPVPSLAERIEDLPALADHYVSQRVRRLGRPKPVLSRASQARLESYPWPGNLDELRSVLDCSLVSSRGDEELEIEESLLDPGRRVGSYQLVRRIGIGSMGEVWLARHRLLVRPAAVKLIRPKRLEDPRERAKALERLEREARATARLSSIHTIRLHDFGVTDEGSLYYVMEHLEGLDLTSIVHGYGPLPAARAIAFMIQACDSLAEAHAAGLVHRDLKPSNLFATRLADEVDVLKVLDFGLVHDLYRTLDADTRKGVVVGTPAFLPPEGTEGKPDARGDIYSLACTLYYLLTGRFVFQEAKGLLEMVRAHKQHAPPLASNHAPHPIPSELDELIWTCMEKDPRRRPQSALELRARLEEIECPEAWGASEARAWWTAYQPQRAPGAAQRELDEALSEATEIASLLGSTRPAPEES